MNKKWVRNSDFHYTLWIDDNKIGEMKIHFKTSGSKAICTIGDKVLEIKRTGFWKSNLEITDNNEEILLQANPEKWYANISLIKFDHKIYKLIIRNNPLAEYAVTRNERDLLVYGLATENRELKVRISTSTNLDVIFDFLLWYLFLPIANENFGDAYSFLISQTL